RLDAGQIASRALYVLVLAVEDDQRLAVELERRQAGQHILGARLLERQPIDESDLVGGILGRERRAHRQAAHLARHRLRIFTRVRAVGSAAALAVGGADRALARAAGALLTIQLARTADDLATPAGIVRAEPSVGLLAHHRLMHHRDVRLDAKDILGDLDRAD